MNYHLRHVIIRPMEKWEYQVFSTNDGDVIALEKMLNDLGQKGWELVSVTTGSRLWAFFKRPIQVDKAEVEKAKHAALIEGVQKAMKR